MIVIKFSEFKWTLKSCYHYPKSITTNWFSLHMLSQDVWCFVPTVPTYPENTFFFLILKIPWLLKKIINDDLWKYVMRTYNLDWHGHSIITHAQHYRLYERAFLQRYNCFLLRTLFLHIVSFTPMLHQYFFKHSMWSPPYQEMKHLKFNIFYSVNTLTVLVRPDNNLIFRKVCPTAKVGIYLWYRKLIYRYYF